MRTSASSSASNRYFGQRLRASSVLPTPVGPRNTNDRRWGRTGVGADPARATADRVGPPHAIACLLADDRARATGISRAAAACRRLPRSSRPVIGDAGPACAIDLRRCGRVRTSSDLVARGTRRSVSRSSCRAIAVRSDFSSSSVGSAPARVEVLAGKRGRHPVRAALCFSLALDAS